MLRHELEAAGSIFQSTSDTEVILHLYARSHRETLEDAIAASLSKVMGAFSLLFLTPDALVAARDPWGFRPLVIGRLEGAYIVCLRDLRARPHRRRIRARRGAGRAGRDRQETACARSIPSRPSPCASASSSTSTSPGRTARSSGATCSAPASGLGRQLARESPADADIVVPVPDSGMGAALGYAEESGLPFQWGLIRNHYVGRTFIEPKQSIRSFGVKIKLNPVRSVLEGKRVVLIDDSIVRGTTSRKIVGMVRDAGAREVHLRISSPPTIGPLLLRHRHAVASAELIASTQLGGGDPPLASAPTAWPTSRTRACWPPWATPRGPAHCTACFSGRYPVAVSQAEDWQLELFEKVRCDGVDRHSRDTCTRT